MLATITMTNTTSADCMGATAYQFAFKRTDAAGVDYYQHASLQSDLEGTMSLKIMKQKTKAGIVSRAMHLTLPIYNGTTSKYEGTAQGRFVLNTPAASDLAMASVVVEMFASALAVAGVKAELVAGP